MKVIAKADTFAAAAKLAANATDSRAIRGPYDAREELEDTFGEVASDKLIDAASAN
jgi:hypothetical protein